MIRQLLSDVADNDATIDFIHKKTETNHLELLRDSKQDSFSPANQQVTSRLNFEVSRLYGWRSSYIVCQQPIVACKVLWLNCWWCASLWHNLCNCCIRFRTNCLFFRLITLVSVNCDCIYTLQQHRISWANKRSNYKGIGISCKAV